MFSPRPWWVAKRGSSASSGRPIASHRRPNTLSALAATTTSAPSPVGYTFDGATPGSTLPERVRVDAAQLEVGHRRLHQRGDRLVDRDVDLLALARSSRARTQRGQRADHARTPTPARRRGRCRPATADGRGCRSCSGCRPSPRRRCRTRPAPASGPVCPKPLTCTITSFGLRGRQRRRSRGPTCRAGPGRKFSSTTSHCSASRAATLARRLLAQVEHDRPLVAADASATRGCRRRGSRPTAASGRRRRVTRP